MAQTVKNLPAMRESWVRSLGQEDPLEEGLQPTPVFLPGKSHGQRSLVGYSPGSRKSRTQIATKQQQQMGNIALVKQIEILNFMELTF